MTRLYDFLYAFVHAHAPDARGNMILFFSKAVTDPTTVQQVTSAVTSVEPYKLKRRTGFGTSLGLWAPALGGV